MILVVDASAVAEGLLHRRAAERIERHIVEHDHSLHPPHRLDVEGLERTAAPRRLR